MSLLPKQRPTQPLNLTRDGYKVFQVGKLVSTTGQGHWVSCKPRCRLGQQLLTSPMVPGVSREPPALLA